MKNITVTQIATILVSPFGLGPLVVLNLLSKKIRKVES